MRLSDHAELADEIFQYTLERLQTLNPSEAMLVMGNVVFQISDRVNVEGKAGIFFDLPVDPKGVSPLEEIFLGALANKRVARGETKKSKVMKRKVGDGSRNNASSRVAVDTNVHQGGEQEIRSGGQETNTDTPTREPVHTRDPNRFKIRPQGSDQRA